MNTKAIAISLLLLAAALAQPVSANVDLTAADEAEISMRDDELMEPDWDEGPVGTEDCSLYPDVCLMEPDW